MRKRMMDRARMLAYITGTVDRELPLRNGYLARENRILKAQLKGRLLLSDAERATLGEIGHRLLKYYHREAARDRAPRPVRRRSEPPDSFSSAPSP